MASVQPIHGSDTDVHHKRTKSSVLKSFIHKRTLSKGTDLSSVASDYVADIAGTKSKKIAPIVSVNHPYARALNELQHNEQSQAFEDGHPHPNGENAKALYKKTKSAISLKSLAARDTEKQTKTRDAFSGKPKKTKSSTSLAALLSRPRSNKNLKKAGLEEELRTEKDKENRTPSTSLPSDSSTQPPIYAQFAGQRFTTQPLGGKFLEDEIDLYTPHEYSPSKQRNFYGGPFSQPTLGQSSDRRRPVSTFLPTSYSIQDIHRQTSGIIRRSIDQPRRTSFESRSSVDRKTPRQELKADSTMAKRGARAIAAVAALGTKAKPMQAEPAAGIDIEDVDTEFEAMLDRRNIPENQRHKMRSLALSMKKDFIRQDWAETVAAQSSRPGTTDSNEQVDDALFGVANREVKGKRPRSRTFTLSKSSKEPTSPTKKQRPESTIRGHSRTRSSDSNTGGYGKTLASTGAAVASTLIAKAQGQLPEDFVAYLRKAPKPELVEVGKLHKLRLLLRNETVAWTDEFIGLGGMNEIVGLLHRTMEVEWRFVPCSCCLLNSIVC